MWEDGECWVIGGGPSMPQQFGIPGDVISSVYTKNEGIEAYSPYLSAIHGKHVIGVNAAFMLGQWIDIMIYGDGHFYWVNQERLISFHGLKISCNPNTRPGKPGVYGLKYVARDGTHLFGLSTKPNMISWNKNTGGAAISLAHKLGVRRILLLGFDMNLSEAGNQHWHSHYPTAGKVRPAAQLPFKRHMECFGPIRRDAARLGVEILNVNPNSAIDEFPKVELKDVL